MVLNLTDFQTGFGTGQLAGAPGTGIPFEATQSLPPPTVNSNFSTSLVASPANAAPPSVAPAQLSGGMEFLKGALDTGTKGAANFFSLGAFGALEKRFPFQGTEGELALARQNIGDVNTVPVEGVGTASLRFNGAKIDIPTGFDPNRNERNTPDALKGGVFEPFPGGGGRIIMPDGRVFTVDRNSNISSTSAGQFVQGTEGLSFVPAAEQSGVTEGGFVDVGQIGVQPGQGLPDPSGRGGGVSGGGNQIINPDNPTQAFDPSGFNANTISFGSPEFGQIDPFIPDTQGLAGARSRELFQQADFLAAQANQFLQGLGALTTERQKGFDQASQNLELAREKALGELGFQFERNKISGGNLRASVEASANAEFAQQQAQLDVQRGESLAQSKLQELEVQTNLIQQAGGLALQAVQANIDDVFQTAEFGAQSAAIQAQMRQAGQQLFAQISALQAETINNQMQLAAQEAQSIRAAIFGEQIAQEQNLSRERIAETQKEADIATGIGGFLEEPLSGGLDFLTGQAGNFLSGIAGNIFGKQGGGQQASSIGFGGF